MLPSAVCPTSLAEVTGRTSQDRILAVIVAFIEAAAGYGSAAHRSEVTSVSEGPVGKVRQDWQRLWSDESSAWYYHSAQSGVVQWEEPEEGSAVWEARYDEGQEAWYWAEATTGETTWESPFEERQKWVV